MKIAIVGPSPVPFTIGGMENLQWGLCDAINKLTKHQCELIKLPSRELNFWDLLYTYHDFYKLDVSHFDMVIYSKYPGWMVQHPRGVCYMAHCLRGLYDTYHLTKLPTEVRKGIPEVDRILAYMENNYLPVSLDEFFDMLFELRECDIPSEYYAFPGPFIRKIVHYLDRWGLSTQKTIAHYSISNTVKERKEYFPEGAEVKVVYPPTTLCNYSSGNYDYVFMMSRLDAPKRIDMLIRAMKHVKSDVKLLIAGTGPEKERLEKLADKDDRIQFLGFVNDEDVEEYYKNSLVIPYFPYDEDYGLITIEAMLHRKPVITTFDAGGPKEFVHDDETGYVVPFDEKEIAQKIDYFAQNPQEAKRMGENAYHEVKDITWEKVVGDILNPIENMPKRKKITVLTTFPVYPPQGGGQARIYDLYREVAKDFDVDIVSFTTYNAQGFEGYIANGLREIRVPQSLQHHIWEVCLQKKYGTIPIADIAMMSGAKKTPEYEDKLRESVADSDYIAISHPFLYSVVKKYIKDKPFIYEAQDVEYMIKKGMLPEHVKETPKLLKEIYELEKECCDRSSFIMACSEKDKKDLCELYHVDPGKVIVVPNGVNANNTAFVSLEERQKNKEALGLGDKKLGLFMGSWHGPNIEACEKIFGFAKECPEVVFLLMGSQCMYFEQKHQQYDIPQNVGFLGLVSEKEKLKIFNCVDFALNPMLSGSGTNLKMFDYMAGGIPVITTGFGTRGINDLSGFIVAEIEDMANAIKALDDADKESLIRRARTIIDEEFDWAVIAEKLKERLKRLS